MRRSKKFIILVVVAAVVLVGSIGAIVLAADNGDESQSKTIFDRVSEILAGKGVTVSSEQLNEAFTQARSDMRDEALDKRLQDLVSQGKIDQSQADQYKAWLKSKPDMEPFRQQLRDWENIRPEVPPDLKQWQESMPDIPWGFGGRGFNGGMRRGGGFCFPR